MKLGVSTVVDVYITKLCMFTFVQFLISDSGGQRVLGVMGVGVGLTVVQVFVVVVVLFCFLILFIVSERKGHCRRGGGCLRLSTFSYQIGKDSGRCGGV